ncbi:MAG: peptide-N-glycosidase F-related protein [bacterium]
MVSVIKNLFVALTISVILFSCSSDSDTKDNNDDIITDSDSIQDKESSDDDTFPENFAEGPYGHKYGDTAGDFSIQTDENTSFVFSEERSSDYSYVFIVNRSGSSQSALLWESTLYELLNNSPENAYYFFISPATGNLFDQQKEAMLKRFERTWKVTGNSAGWENRVFFVRESISEMDSWIRNWFKTYSSDYVFIVDRFQKIRSTGLLHSWKTQTMDPVLKALSHEVSYHNFLYERKNIMDHLPDHIEIEALSGEKFEDGTIVFDVKFPDADEMKRYNGLQVDLRQDCKNPADCEWDRIMHLYVDRNGDGSCNTEIARWITTYGLSGRWVTDISPLLPLIKEGGTQKFRLYVWGDQYENHLSFRLLEDKQKESAPSDIIPLFSGNPRFDENYNDAYEVLETEIPSDVNRVEIAAYVTGHGNGSEAENCAEFCPFEQVFVVNDKKFSKKHSEASDAQGCVAQIEDGVVPNQYGSWPYGRAGWCPGLDVKPWVIDISDSVKKGAVNTFALEAYLNGEVYVPEVTDPDGYRAEINTSAYLLLY